LLRQAYEYKSPLTKIVTESRESSGSSVSIVTSLRVERPVLDSQQGRGFLYHRVQTRSGAHPASLGSGLFTQS